MADDLAKVETTIDSVTIKIPKEKLSDFFGDFLKTKRQIGRRYPVVFNMKKEDVISIISVIDHRISEQNEAVRTDFLIEVLFDDGSNRNYPSIEFFRNLDDNLSAKSLAVYIKLTYLIRFPDEESPTKQEISIFASSREMGYSWSTSPAFQEPNLFINITTNRFTWAEDIINHFSNYVKGKFDEVGRVTRFFNYFTQSRQMNSLSAISMAILLMLMVIFAFGDSLEGIKDSYKGFSSLIGGSTIESANAKLDAILSHSMAVDFKFFSLETIFPYILYYFTAVLTVFVFPTMYCVLSDASYVSIGQNSVDKNDRKIRRRKALKSGLFGSVVLSISCSVFASFIWERLSHLL